MPNENVVCAINIRPDDASWTLLLFFERTLRLQQSKLAEPAMFNDLANQEDGKIALRVEAKLRVDCSIHF